MKVLKVYGDGDYGAVHFETAHGGKNVDDIIANPDAFLPTDENDEYEQWSLEVLEFGDVDSKFVAFVKGDMRSYEDSKHENFWMEGETVKI
jgi:hypothetical protein